MLAKNPIQKTVEQYLDAYSFRFLLEDAVDDGEATRVTVHPKIYIRDGHETDDFLDIRFGIEEWDMQGTLYLILGKYNPPQTWLSATPRRIKRPLR